MEIRWKPGGGVQLIDLSEQEWGWLKKVLSSHAATVADETASVFIQQLRDAAPINAVSPPREKEKV